MEEIFFLCDLCVSARAFFFFSRRGAEIAEKKAILSGRDTFLCGLCASVRENVFPQVDTRPRKAISLIDPGKDLVQ
jgi:hypothetical protein